MTRLSVITMAIFTVLLLACAGTAPTPEPGMEVLHHGHGEEIQVATDVEGSRYSKIILHTAPVEFRKNWQSDQERLLGKKLREKDLERIKKAVSDQFANVMVKKLTERGGYEFTDENGAGVMHFMPNIVNLDVQAAGWIQSSIVESMDISRGSMTIEMVIRDSVSDQLLAVAWQNQSDPRGGDMDMTYSVNNSQAFRLMMQSYADWLMRHLEEIKK